MAKFGEADGMAAPSRGRTLARTLLACFDGLVAPSVTAAGERGCQARTIGALVGVGLTAALFSPFAALSPFTPQAVVASTALAGICLALAGYLAGSGRLGVVLAAISTLLAAAIGIAGAWTGGLQSPLLPLLLVAPVEAMLAGRRPLAGVASGTASLAFGTLALAEWLGLAPRSGLTVDGTTMLGFGLLYAGLQTGRLMQARAAGQAAEALKHAEARLVDDSLTDMVLRFAPDGRLVSASSAATAFFDRGQREPTAEWLLSRMHVTDRVRYLQAFGEMRSGSAALEIGFKMQVGEAEGRGFREIVLKLLPVRGADGRLLSILCIGRDVTQERARTAELTEALALAEKNSEAKSQFLAAISHELRTPLNAIIGFSDVLDQEFFGGFANPRQKEYVGLIRQSGGHLLSVVNGLLDVAKIEAGRYELHMEAFSIEEALLAAGEVIRPEADAKGLALDLRLGRCRGAEIVADRRACHQILLNLLSNAVKFTDQGVVTLAGDMTDGMLAIAVSDTGIGIAAHEIGRLGQPFTQLSSGLSRRYQGTGLGLSLVKGLGDLHHGSMEIASELGRGTVVTVRIPLDCAARIEDSKHSKENVVALAHARKKPHPAPQTRPARRTA